MAPSSTLRLSTHFFGPDGGVIDYGAAKTALVNVVKSLSQELVPSGIRITSVSPGPVATDLWLGEHGVAETVGGATGESADAVRDQMAASMPISRFTTPREVATIVALLASLLHPRPRRPPHGGGPDARQRLAPTVLITSLPGHAAHGARTRRTQHREIGGATPPVSVTDLR